MIITMAVPTAAMAAKHDMNMHEEIWKQNNLNLLKKGPKNSWALIGLPATSTISHTL